MEAESRQIEVQSWFAAEEQHQYFHTRWANIRDTVQGVDAQGNTTTVVLMHIYDGQPHPTTGSPNIDASAYTRVDANTIIFTRLKAGKLLAIGSGVVSQDGKTWTVTTTGTALGFGNGIAVYDKQ